MTGRHYCRFPGCRVQVMEGIQWCSAHRGPRRRRRLARKQGGKR